jgi:hypothetical protein
MNNYREIRLQEIRERNFSLSQPDLQTLDSIGGSEIIPQGFEKNSSVSLRFLEKFFASSRRKLYSDEKVTYQSFASLSAEAVDSLYDRRKLRKTFRALMLSADKVEHLGKVPVPGKGTYLQIGLSMAKFSISRSGPFLEHRLIGLYTKLVATSYGFNPDLLLEKQIYDALTRKGFKVNITYGESLISRVALVNKLAIDTNLKNIDECLERIDDLYCERMLLKVVEN